MKNVCFLNGHLILRNHKTGVHYFHENITKKIAFNHEGYNLVVGYFNNKETDTAIEKDDNKWIASFCKSKPSWMRIFSYILPISLFFGKNDVYFCDGLFPITFGKAKRICLVHDLMVKIYPQNYSFIKKIYLNLFFCNLPKADLVICVSETTKNDIIKYYGVNPEKILVCYNGVDKIKKYDVEFDSVNNASLSNKYLLYLGDMRPNKNLYNTTKGFLTFCEQNDLRDLYFYIAGKKNGDFDSVKALTEKSKYGKQVVFLGYVDDKQKYALYHNTLAVVLLSKYEGFGMPIIEGMQHYKPIITSNVSSMKEIGEGTAILADPEDINSISSAISKIYTADYSIDFEEYEKKLKRYTFENVANIIDEGIRRVMEV